MTVGQWIILALLAAMTMLVSLVVWAVVAHGDTPVRCTPEGACVDAIDSPYVMRRQS